MRKAVLILAQFGSFVLVLVSGVLAVVALTRGELESIALAFGGALFWFAMFYVFGATDDYLTEKQQQEKPDADRPTEEYGIPDESEE